MSSRATRVAAPGICRAAMRCASWLLQMLLLTAGSAAVADVIKMVDDRGRELLLGSAPRRIVSLAPHATELLFAAGLGPRVVAIDLHSDQPDQARHLPRLNALSGPDPERLMALDPDLVVIWGAAADRDRVQRLERLGLRVFISEPRTLEAVATTLERFAALSPTPQAGRAGAARVRASVMAVRQKFASRKPVPVFVQAWSRPLTSLSDRDIVGDALRACGGRNLFGDAAIAAPQVGVEAVLAARPHLILTFGPDADRQPWDALGVLAPRGPIQFAVLGQALLRPSQRLPEELPALCEAIQAARR